MRSKLKLAGYITLAATMVSFFGIEGSGAAAQDRTPVLMPSQPEVQFTSSPVVQALPAEPVEVEAVTPDSGRIQAGSLAELVAAQPRPDRLSPEMHCLAGAIYFESRGQTLPGQLAVGRVVVNRAKSSRFPNSYCGVVYQPSQFSFVRGKKMPAIAKNSRAWKNAVAIAQIAHENSWESDCEGALYFHAARVSPGWRMTRIARVDDHIFYR